MEHLIFLNERNERYDNYEKKTYDSLMLPKNTHFLA